MLKNTQKLVCDKISSGERLDIFLSKKINSLTRSNIKNIIKSSNVKINGDKTFSQSKKIKENDVVEINFIRKTFEFIQPSKKKINIVFEDKDIVIVDKPQGMVVHPGAGNKLDTLVNILVNKYKKELSNISGELRPGIVHRIDKETSGILVIAKNNFTHSNLGEQFSNHTIKRKYLALVWGVLRPLSGRIKTFIIRSRKNRQLMEANDKKGKVAITNYKTLKVFGCNDIPKISLVEFDLETGRTHQIRAHMNYKKTSLLGDDKYKKKNQKYKKINKYFKEYLDNLKGQALHAYHLEFNHPRSNKKMGFNSKLPKKFEKMIKFLEKQSD